MRSTFVLTGLGVLAALHLGSLHSMAAVQPGVSVGVQLDDAVGLPADLVREAKLEVERTFLAARVRIVWIQQPDDLPPNVRRLQVVIISGPPLQFRGPEASVEGAAGNAVRELGRAQVFYRRLTAAAALHPVAVSTVLGHVIAHELGHLLLPSHSHTDVGIMRHVVDFRHLGIRRFTEEQSTLIRAALCGANSEVSPCS